MRRDEFKRRMDSLWWEQSMTDTPRTEKIAQTVEYSADDFEHGLLVEVVDADFARQLERELAAMTKRLEAAERVIDAARSVDISIRKHRPIDNNDAEELAQELCKYDERFGGRDD